MAIAAHEITGHSQTITAHTPLCPALPGASATPTPGAWMLLPVLALLLRQYLFHATLGVCPIPT
ncbi:hypothetical protein, partial [Gracilinema caldarium]|uniref:hypothetical protein n=1 Tax=Gracilinema caldarium TaxID=215591 RepID=UPI0026ED5CC1